MLCLGSCTKLHGSVQSGASGAIDSQRGCLIVEVVYYTTRVRSTMWKGEKTQFRELSSPSSEFQTASLSSRCDDMPVSL